MTPMNWPALYPEMWLLVMANVVLLVDIYLIPPAQEKTRGLTFWLTQCSLAVFAWLHDQCWAPKDPVAARSKFAHGGMIA